MEDKRLDHIIKEKLERLDVPYKPSTWDALQERMDADAQAETEAFDEGVRQKLQHWEAGYQSEHWELLEGQMDAVAARRLLYRYKATELALVFLILFTIGQFLPTNSIPSGALLASKEKQEQLVEKKAEATHSVDTDQTIDTKTHVIADREVKVVDDKSTTDTAQNSSATNTLHSLIPAAAMQQTESKNKTTALEKQQLTQEKEKIEPTVISEVPFSTDVSTSIELKVEATSSLDKNRTPLEVKSIVKEDVIAAHPASLSSILENKNIVPKLKLGKFLGLSRLEKKATAAITHEFNKENIIAPTNFLGHSKMRIGLMTSADVNYVQTPVNKRYNFSAYNTLSIGYSAGLSIGWKQGRTELESGLIYSHKLFELPFFIVRGAFLSGFEGERLSQLGFDILELPVQIKHDFIQQGQWRFYGMLGASMHIVTNEITKFERISEDAIAEINKGSDPRDNKDYAGLPITSESNLFAPAPDEGNDTKNSFADSYFSVNGGIGIEYRTSERWSIFVQPTFKYTITNPDYGIGSYNNVIHNSSLLVGVKVGI